MYQGCNVQHDKYISYMKAAMRVNPKTSHHKERICFPFPFYIVYIWDSSKFYKPGFSSMWTVNFQIFKLVLEKAEESEIKLPTSAGSLKKQKSPRKTSISALLTIWKTLTVWITINWKILREMGIPDHLSCLLRNLYAGQEATVRTGHRTTD